MKFIQAALRSINPDLSHHHCYLSSVRTIFTNNAFGNGSDGGNKNSIESDNDFQQRIFDQSSGNNQNSSFYDKLDKMKLRRQEGFSSNTNGSFGGGSRSSFLGDQDFLDESFNTLSDGLDGKLKNAAKYFEYDDEEVSRDGYSFRPDVSIQGETYDIKDLDLKRPGVSKPAPRYEFETTTEEVLRKADFRNVRFLAKFLTEAGIIIKRSQTKISAKAQRKVAREIKTARAFGLMPFTTMGEYPFVFGRTREDIEEDDDYERYVAKGSFVDSGPTIDSFVDSDPVVDSFVDSDPTLP